MNLEEWKKKYGASASEPSSDLQSWKNKYANFTPEPIETPQKIDVATRGIQAFGASGTNVPKITLPTPAPTPKVPTIDPRYAAIPQAQDYAEFSTAPKTEKKGVIGYFKDVFTGNDIYDYINDIDNYRNKVKLSATATNAENNYIKYDYMTPDEIGTYNYLNTKEGKDSAKEYLKAIDDSLAQRQGSAIAGNIKGKTGLEVLYGVNAGINQYKQGTKQLFSKESVGNTPVDYAAEIIREDLKDNGAKVSGNSLAQLGFDVLNTTANMAPSILLSTLGAGLLGTAGVSAKVVQKASQILGATTMGASAGGQAYKQALDDGYTTEQARLYGTLVGASEGALQYLIGGIGSLGGISSEKLVAKVAGINNAIARMALTGAIKIGSEITEEELQNFLQPAFETLIFKKEYDLPTWDEVAYTAIITALSTGALSAGEIASAGKKQTATKAPALKVPVAPEATQAETQQTPSALPPLTQTTVAPIVESAETVLDNALANPTGEGGRISNAQLSDIVSDQTSMEALGLNAESLRNMTASQRRNAVRSAIDSYSAAEMVTAPITPAKANLILPQTAPIVQQTEAIPATDAETRDLPPLTATDNAPTLALPAKQSAPTGLQSSQAEQMTGGIENGGTEITLPGKTGSNILRQGSERNIPQRQGRELGGVSDGTEAVRTGWQSTGIPKDSQRESLKYAEAVTADTILPEAQKDQTVYRDASETDSVRNSHSLAKKNGYVIEAWGGGEISIRTGGTIRAFTIPGTDRIGVQTDNNEIASEDLTRHEIMEQKILRGEVSVDEVLSGAEQYIDPAKIQEVIEFYHRGYPSEGINHARSELVCDGADHINQLRYDVEQGRLGGSFKEFADLIDEVIGAINRTANEITDGAFELDGEIERLKSIDNKNPTADTDIRYSSKVKAEEGTAPVSQEIDSADTSLNQLPALFTDKNAEFGEVNIDIGGGEYDRATEYLDSIGTRNLIFDPYNRPEDINTSTLEFLRDGNKADTATCANVLNVIREPTARANVILEAAKAIKPDGKAYFTVYEGNGSGNGRITKIREGKPANWQNHRKTATYIDEIGKYFQEVSKKGKLLIATDPISNLPKASWEVSPGKGILYSSKVKAEDNSDNLESLRSEIDAAYRETVKLSKERAEYEKRTEYERFIERINTLTGKALHEAIEEYKTWETASGFAAMAERQEALNKRIRELQKTLDSETKVAVAKAKAGYRALYNDEFAKKYATKAARKFGTTSRFNLAGYLTVNGTLLDFSERQGYRVQDHREIAEVLDFLPDEHEYSDGLIEFMNMGNIRLQSYGIDIAKAPNKEQISALRRFFDNLNGEVTVDFSNEEGNNMGSVDYPEGTRADRIIRDISNYFTTGEVPTISDMQRFRSSSKITTFDSLQEENTELRDKLEELKTASKTAERMTDKAEYWKGQTKRTAEPTLRQSDVDKLAKSIIKNYDSTLTVNDISDKVKALGEFILRGGNETDELTWTDVKDMATAIAREIVGNAESLVNYGEAKTYKRIKNYLRRTYLSFDDKGDIADWADFRKRNFGRFIISNDGLPVDVAYQELTSTFGEGYFPSDIIHPTEQILHISDLFDQMQPIYENPHSAYMAEAVEYCANEIIDGLIDESVRQTAPTFADRQAAKLEKAKGETAAAKQATKEAIAEGKENAKSALLVGQMNQGAKMAKEMRTLQERSEKRIAAAKQAVEKERTRRQEQVANLKEHFRTKESNSKNSRKAKSLRSKINKHVKDLSVKLLRPSDKRHIPDALLEPVARLLEAVNMESNYEIEFGTDAEYHRVKPGESRFAEPTKRTKAFIALRDAYKKIGGDLSFDPDLMFWDADDKLQTGELMEAVIDMADVRVADMTTEQLEKVWKTLKAIEASIRSANKMFSAKRFETVSEPAEAIKRDNAYKKERGYVGKIASLLSVDMLTPEAYFHRLGETGDALFRMMRDSQDEYISILGEAVDFWSAELSDVDIRKLDKEIHTVILGGKEVQLPTSFIMEMYVLMQRGQAVPHILEGGILPDTITGKGRKKIATAEPSRGVTLQEVSDAVSLLTAEQITAAEKMQGFLAKMGEHGNKASMEVYNYKKFNEDAYWPIRTNSQETKSSIEKFTPSSTVANKGFTKTPVPNANTSIRIGSIFDTFANHVTEMATYAAYLGTTEDMNRIRNFVYRDSNKNRIGAVKEEIDRVFGVGQGTHYLHKLLSDVANGLGGGITGKNYLGGLTANYKAAAVGANLRVFLQQFTAILRALDMMDAKYMAAGLKPNKGWQKAKKYSPIAQWKDWGYFDINTGRQLKDVLFNSGSALTKARQIAMKPASWMDSISWGMLWNACELETKDLRKDLNSGTKEFNNAVAERFNEIIDHSQVVDGILQRSQIMRNTDSVVKMAVSFMGEPTKTYNMFLGAVYDARNAKTTEAKTKAQKRLARTVISLLIAGATNAAVQSIVDALRDDDKEKDYWEKWLKSFVGFEGDEEGFGKKFAAFWNGNLEAIINPAQYVPFAKDFISILQGYDVSRMDMESIEKTTYAIQNMMKALSDDGKYTISSAFTSLLAESSRLLGLPVANVKRDLKAIVDTIATESGNYLLQYRMEKAMLSMDYSGNNKTFLDILYGAKQNDEEAYQFIYDDLIKNGVDAKKIASGMESRMKREQGVKSVYDLENRFLTPDQQEAYDESTSKLQKSNVWKKANAEQRDEVLNLLHGLTTDANDSASKSARETISGGKKVGLNQEEYLLYKLALPIVDEPTESGKYGSYTNDEVEAAIRMIDGLTDEERAYLWNAQGKNENSNPFSNDMSLKLPSLGGAEKKLSKSETPTLKLPSLR